MKQSIMESLAKNIEKQIDSKIETIKAGEDIVVFTVAKDESYVTFRQMGDALEMIILLSRFIKMNPAVKLVVEEALKLSEVEHEELDRIVRDGVRFDEIFTSKKQQQ